MALRQGHVTLAQALRDVFVLPIETRGREPPRFHKLWAFVVGPQPPGTHLSFSLLLQDGPARIADYNPF